LNEGPFARHANKSTDASGAEKTIAQRRWNSQDQDPPTSPIEDPSLTSSFHLNDQVSEASTLYLEVKKRVAHHTTRKRRDKVVKLDLKPTDILKTEKVAAPLADKSSIIYVSSSPSTRASSPNLAPQDILVTEVNKSIAITDKTQTKVVMGKKAKPQLLTPMEYAQRLNEQVTKSFFVNAEKKYVRFLVGKHVFYTGGDMNYASKTTRGRMDLVRSHNLTLKSISSILLT
jgi:DNA polymerase lambda